LRLLLGAAIEHGITIATDWWHVFGYCLQSSWVALGDWPCFPAVCLVGKSII